MRLQIISITNKLTRWISEGIQEYHKRFPQDFSLSFIDIPLKRTQTQSIEHAKQKEAEQILSYLKKGSLSVLLDVQGKTWSTEKFAAHLEDWQQKNSSVNFIIGGPDGVDASIINAVHHQWSLSALTFPHAVVKIILVEQLYRAISILKNHPYHRQ